MLITESTMTIGGGEGLEVFHCKRQSREGVSRVPADPLGFLFLAGEMMKRGKIDDAQGGRNERDQDGDEAIVLEKKCVEMT